MNQETKHTPTPWFVKPPQPARYPEYQINDAYGKRVATIQIMAHNPAGSDAAFIVRACNAHDELVATLEAANQFILDEGHANTGKNPLSKIWMALAKARGEA